MIWQLHSLSHLTNTFLYLKRVIVSLKQTLMVLPILPYRMWKKFNHDQVTVIEFYMSPRTSTYFFIFPEALPKYSFAIFVFSCPILLVSTNNMPQRHFKKSIYLFFCPFVCGWNEVKKFSFMPSNLNNSVQNLPMNRISQSLAIDQGIP